MGHIQIFGKTKIEGKTVFSQSALLYDPTAAAYIAAVEAADGQALENYIKTAYNDFIVGCKADGIWNAIKSSCILAGARTLSGALVPLVGTAPTNFNFVSGDYNRKTGLIGNRTSKYLACSRNNVDDPQNNRHFSVYCSQADTGSRTSSTRNFYLAAWDGNNGMSGLHRFGVDGVLNFHVVGAPILAGDGSLTGFIGARRSASNAVTYRAGGNSTNFTQNSFTPKNLNWLAFRSVTGAYSNARQCYYSIGESLDLALLDTRVSALMTAINAAI
jgi:hypothetical protein